ncbi:MAG: HD-GYP domain-containing protein [Armatimonadota bacterium]|nr:HD-GYP domain-containing protein [Armatimonadota bacterium]
MSSDAGRAKGPNEDVYQQTVHALVAATGERDDHAQGHSERVTAYCMAIAKHLDLDEDTVRNLRYAAGLHDVGKIGISRNILNKLGKLTDEEFEIMRMHSLIAVRILEKVDGLKDALPMIRHHHERFDGGGYPDGLAGEAIPIGSRIISVAEAYDILTSDVPWRNAMGEHAALAEIDRCGETQFDPAVVKALITAVGGG